MRSTQPGVSTVASPSILTITSPVTCSTISLSRVVMPPCSRSRSVKRGMRPESPKRLRIATLSSVEPSSAAISSTSG